jgi:hypothetical protein
MGCYPVLPDVDGASVISQPDTSRVLPDAIAPSLACTPEFARRASWSHAIEVSGYFYLVYVLNGYVDKVLVGSLDKINHWIRKFSGIIRRNSCCNRKVNYVGIIELELVVLDHQRLRRG